MEATAVETETAKTSWVGQIQRSAAAPARVVDPEGREYASLRCHHWRVAGLVADIALTVALQADLYAHWAPSRRAAPPAPAATGREGGR